jgi:hypothetical protein
MKMPGPGHRKIRLTRDILVKGEHTEKGSVLTAPAPLAASLVGDGSAEYHEDSKDEVAEENRKGVTVHEPHVQSADPEIRKVSDPPAKPKAKSGA